MEITIADKLDYWKKKLKVESEWLTVEFEPRTITIVHIEDLTDVEVAVIYFYNQYPEILEFLPVDQFVDGRFIRKN